MLVREVLIGIADAVEMTPDVLNDVRTAVTEACNNVVLHAYGDEEGLLEVEAYCAEDAIQVIVRDRGIGIRPQITAPYEGTSGVGLLVIQALAQSVTFQGEQPRLGREDQAGTDVCMTFAAPAIRVLEAPGSDSPEPDDGQAIEQLAETPDSGATISIAPAILARTVLPRLLSALAARARFRADRISDAQLVADVLAKHASETLERTPLRVRATIGLRELTLRVAPLGADYPERPAVHAALDGLGGVIERLTDDQQVAEVGASEVLALRMIDPR